MDSGVTKNLYGVWGSSGSNVMAVGYEGTVIRYDGINWTPMESGTTEQLNAIWGSSLSNVFTVGAGGTILYYNGSAWAEMTSGSTDQLKGVWGISESSVFAVGTYGTILHYNSGLWSPMESGTSNQLNSIWGSSLSSIFTVGYAGTILRYDGSPIVPTTTTTIVSPQPCLAEIIYGSHSEQTEHLRYFRDNILTSTPEGQEIIRLYYELSPAIVKAMEEDEEFREQVNEMIGGVLELIGERVK